MAIKPGLSICLEEVIALEKQDDQQTKVYTRAMQFDSTIPYETFLQILAAYKEDEGSTGQMAADIKQLRLNSQTFGG